MAWPTVGIETTSMDESTDDPSQARAEIKQMADNVNAIRDARNSANGIAPLDSESRVPSANLPTIAANKGGTGQTAYTVGDMFYANTESTLTKLSAAVAGYVLTSNGPGAAPSWQQAGGGLVATTRLAFNQTTAPTGWTKDTTHNDSLMRIVSGTVGNGGSQAFSEFNEQNSTGAHTLTISQIPSHTHVQRQWNSGSSGGSPAVQVDTNGDTTNVSNWNGNLSTAAAGSGGGHSHGLTHDIKYNDFIIAVKD